MEQPPGFEEGDYSKVYRLHKAVYGLKQAPRAWYETLSSFIIESGFKRGSVDKTLFTIKVKDDILLVQIYVDDIIFGSKCPILCNKFGDLMKDRYKMSMMGEMNFFLGLQVKQSKEGIFISETKYSHELVDKFGVKDSKAVKVPMLASGKIDPDPEGKPANIT